MFFATTSGPDVTNTRNGERGSGNECTAVTHLRIQNGGGNDVYKRMLLIPGTGNGERGTGNGERGTGNGERGTGVWERVYSCNSPENSKWWRKRRLQTLILSLGRVDD